MSTQPKVIKTAMEFAVSDALSAQIMLQDRNDLQGQFQWVSTNVIHVQDEDMVTEIHEYLAEAGIEADTTFVYPS